MNPAWASNPTCQAPIQSSILISFFRRSIRIKDAARLLNAICALIDARNLESRTALFIMVAAPEHIIDLIHEAGLVPALWPEMLQKISLHVGGNGGSIMRLSNSYVSAASSPNFEQMNETFMRDGWAERDQAVKRGLALNHTGFFHDGDLFSNEEIESDYVYRNFYRPHGMGYRAATIIPIPNGDSTGFVFYRHQDNGPVPRVVIDTLDALRPFLARASLTASRLGFMWARAQAETLQALGLPGAVLDRRGRVLACNNLFDVLMPSVFQDRAQRLTISNVNADALLSTSLDAISRTKSYAVRSIPIAAADERVPVIVHVVPVRNRAQDLFSQAAAFVIATPIDRANVPTAEVLQGLFDLTPAEARVARQIGRAQTVEELAAALGVSRETIRSQLQAVLRKTGVARQAELVALLAGSALPKSVGDGS